MARTKTRQRLILENREHLAEVARLRNRIYAAERENESQAEPFRIRVRELEQALRIMTTRHDDAARRADACERAFYGITAAMHEIHLASGKAPT